MTRLVRATEIIGLPLVTADGDDVAEVRDVIFEPGRGRLEGFTLNGRGLLSGRMDQVAPIDLVTAIGDAAVMIGDGRLTDRDEAPDAVRDASSDRNVIGAPVITEEGTELGEIVDVVVSLGREPRAVGYELGGSKVASGEGEGEGRVFVPLPDQISVSGDALMVPADLRQFVRKDLDELGRALSEYRSRGGARSSGPSPGGDDGPTKEELYEEAQRRDVPGRSSMSKAELATALDDGESS